MLMQPFGSATFSCDSIYVGLYSSSGINIHLGCSFKTDTFADGQLTLSSSLAKLSRAPQVFSQENEDDIMIKKLLTPGLKPLMFKKLMK